MTNSEPGYWRPKSLDRFEDNNGWTRIDPDGSNLPKDEAVKYRCAHFIDGIVTYTDFMCENVKINFYRKVITHYKPIEQELLPIY